ncbi:hypothetical protein Tco_0380772, partial [Tanacetum coccineum]
MDNIIRVLHVFYLASGLKINIHKSNIYDIGVNKDEVLSMASNAGCMAGDIPFNYLGLWNGYSRKRTKDKVKSKSKVNQVKKIQLKGLKLPSL